MGKHCVIVDHQSSTSGTIAKIFDVYPQDALNRASLEDMRWGDLPGPGEPNMSVPLDEATKIQNICAMHDLAPRVLEIIGLTHRGQKYFAQVIEKVDGEFANTHADAYPTYAKVKKLGEMYGFGNDKDDCSNVDVIGGKLIDFNTFHFKDGYEDKIRDKYGEYAKYGKKYYHPIPELGLTGSPRKESRFKEMGLDKIDFKGATVYDLGCAGGMMCREAKRRGAGQVVGFDFPGYGSPDPIRGAQLASIMLGYYDIDYINVDLIRDLAIHESKSDIVFALSLNFHFDVLAIQIKRLKPEVLIFEDNSVGRDAYTQLSDLYEEVEEIGKTTDHDPERGKDIYHCRIPKA